MTAVTNVKRANWLTHTIVVVLIVVLFVAGIKLGSALSMPDQATTNSAANAGAKAPGGALVQPAFEVKNFTLTNQDGKPMSLTELRGRVVVLFFGYTHCPDVCPTTLADYTRVKQELGADAAKVAFVFVSVDAERDKPAVVREFLGQFDPGFVGLTGEDVALRTVATQFGSYYKVPDHKHGGEGHKEQVNSQNYFVEHTSPSFLIDSKGYLRLVYFYGSKTEDLTAGIRQLLVS